MNDTIAAISTPIGPGAIGIIRLSGPASKAILQRIFRPTKAGKALSHFRLRLGHIVNPKSDETIDEVLVSFMRSPYSYTREDMVEINSHSGIQVLSAILELVLEEGARLARPGEFTYRAFLNGRLDLSQAEAVSDMVSSCSPRAVSIAAHTLEGGLSHRVHSLRGEIATLLAELEALIDFPEDDVAVDLDGLAMRVNGVIADLDSLIDSHRARKLWFQGIHVVISGRVNAGKSSLLNRIVEAPKAIVTPIPGTTRDLVEVPYLLEGIPIRLIDTAGLGIPRDEAETMGIERARAKIRDADLVLLVVDQSAGLTEEDKGILEGGEGRVILVLNKCDLPIHLKEERLREYLTDDVPVVYVSALTGQNIQRLKEMIREKVLSTSAPVPEERLSPNIRQTQALCQARDALAGFIKLLNQGLPLDIMAQHLWEAVQYLDEITGRDISQEVLEEIFSRFCIGK